MKVPLICFLALYGGISGWTSNGKHTHTTDDSFTSSKFCVLCFSSFRYMTFPSLPFHRFHFLLVVLSPLSTIYLSTFLRSYPPSTYLLTYLSIHHLPTNTFIIIPGFESRVTSLKNPPQQYSGAHEALRVFMLSAVPVCCSLPLSHVIILICSFLSLHFPPQYSVGRFVYLYAIHLFLFYLFYFVCRYLFTLSSFFRIICYFVHCYLRYGIVLPVG